MIRQATIACNITPVLCGTAFKNKGVQLLLDAVLAYLPSPEDVALVIGHDVDDREKTIERKISEKEPFAALALKIMSDPHVGKLTYTRVYSGRLEAGSYVYNISRDINERVGR